MAMASHEDIFKEGPLQVRIFTVKDRRRHSAPALGKKKQAMAAEREALARRLPPKPLMISAPEAGGDYPIVFFYHGFLLLNCHYSQLLQQIASHGFIAIAPQMYVVTGADATKEIADAAAIINWLPEGLGNILSEHLGPVQPMLDKIALVGHSRGAKVAFGLGLGFAEVALKFSAIVGLDPVDGRDVHQQTAPPILKFSSQCLKPGLPILIVGAGLASLKRNSFSPPCAPAGVNHEAFFADCSEPTFYFVVSEHGHMDFLDDSTRGLRGRLSYCTCRNGSSRAPMRRFSAGIVVAFLQAAMFCKCQALQDLVSNPTQCPVRVEEPKWHLASSAEEASSGCPDLSSIFS